MLLARIKNRTTRTIAVVSVNGRIETWSLDEDNVEPAVAALKQRYVGEKVTITIYTRRCGL